MRDHILQRRQRGKLLKRRHELRESQTTQKRQRADTGAHVGDKPDQGHRRRRHREEPGVLQAETSGSGSRRVGRAARGQHDWIWRALRFHISKVRLECSLWNTTSAETKVRLRAMELLRERKNGQSVLVGRRGPQWPSLAASLA